METQLNQLISEAITGIRDFHKIEVVRKSTSFSWGDFEQCKELFVQVFLAVDKTINKFTYLPEYDEIVRWMTNTEGRGLLLRGAKGRGKTTILMCVLPVLFKIKGYVLKPLQAIDITYEQFNQVNKTVNLPNLEYLKRNPFPAIDELGIEPQVNDFGEKFEGFNQIIDKAEQRIKPLFITTNLEPEQILKRYDSRTLDRLGRLCKTVVFKGDSLRQ
jgi:DNA replication protein DnaC